MYLKYKNDKTSEQSIVILQDTAIHYTTILHIITIHMRIIVSQAHWAHFCVLYSRWRWW